MYNVYVRVIPFLLSVGAKKNAIRVGKVCKVFRNKAAIQRLVMTADLPESR